MSSWQIWTYCGVSDGQEIPGEPMFDGYTWPTRKEAEAFWYDSAPGRNDRFTLVKLTHK